MANALKPTECGTIGITFSAYALVRKTKEERDEYLKMIRHKIGLVLDEFRNQSNMMDGWFIDLHETPDD